VTSLLRELRHVPQKADEPARRWFAAQGMDLIVWIDKADHITGYQLCYEKGNEEFALTWTRDKGFHHAAVDSGEQLPTKNRTPILIAAGACDARLVSSLFEKASPNVPARIRALVDETLRRYPKEPGRTTS
jgi:hypothetical protein